MKHCKICGKDLSKSNKTGMCNTCQFKEKYPNVDYEEHNQFLKQTKAILKSHEISYEKFSELIGYDYDTVSKLLAFRIYSQNLIDDINCFLKNIGH